MSANGSGMFASLRIRNYRVWAGGALVSNVGTWLQRVAQDWLVLTVLTHHSASAMGVAMALQFGPPLLLLPWSGYAADRFDRRKLLIATQAALGLLALGLGLVTVAGVVTLWQVYVFALLLGCVSAFDAPARQVFVNDLVGDQHLVNAVALNSSSFNASRMIGPAIAGLLIAAVGCGWVFLINAASFMAVLASLALLRVDELHRGERKSRKVGGLAAGVRYVWRRPDLMAVLVMLFLVGMFGLNFPIFISTMSLTAFHGGAAQYGLLTSVFAVGAVCGALYSAYRSLVAPRSVPRSLAGLRITSAHAGRWVWAPSRVWRRRWWRCAIWPPHGLDRPKARSGSDKSLTYPETY